MIVRDGSRGGESWTGSGSRLRRIAATSSAIAGWRIVSTYGRPATTSGFSIRRAAYYELQVPVRINGDDAFHHAGQDRFHPAPVTRLFRKTLRDVLHGCVQRTRHITELVVAEVDPGRCQVTGAVTTREVHDTAHAP
jgi:hypothetical protein